jgi:NADH dehydrogenase
LLFLTGGTGFIGRRLVAALMHARVDRVRCLIRSAASAVGEQDSVETVVGDLRNPSTYAQALRGCDVVVHLAAMTGKAKPEEYVAVNVEGTRNLLGECTRAGVRRVIFVSSIAATYRDKKAYYYAESKALAEQLVRESGLNYLIVRPTFVLGEGSPIWHRLVSLAALPVAPVFGDGRVRVQPIYVGDVVTFLVAMIGRQALPDEAVDLGGPDVMTLEDLMRGISRAVRGREAPIIHVPVRGAMAVLARAERWLFPILPVSAGQFSSFINDSVVTHGPVEPRDVPKTTMSEMLQRLANRS